MSKNPLLFDKHPLLIQPTLATKIGLNEAIVVQQLNYWIENPECGITDGDRRWIYNTYAQWATNFPFWSDKTIRRILIDLQEQGIIMATDRFNKDRSDRTKWYSIDYDALDLKTGSDFPNGKSGEVNLTKGAGQSDQVEEVNLTKSLIGTETTTETTSETTNTQGVSEFRKTFSTDYPRPLYNDETESGREKAFTRESHKIAYRFENDVNIAARYLLNRLKAYKASLYVHTANPQFLPYGRNWLLTKEYEKADSAWHKRAKRTVIDYYAHHDEERDQLASVI